MNTEQFLELYDSISRLGGGKGIQTMTFWAINQPRYCATGSVLCHPIKPLSEMTADELHTYHQGFGCVEVVVRNQWGGCDYDGKPLERNRVAIDIYDRRERWDGRRWSGRLGQWALAERASAVDIASADAVVELIKNWLNESRSRT